jgi:hypothetical protein
MKNFRKLLSLALLSAIIISFSACEDDDDDVRVETRIVEKEIKKYNATIKFNHLVGSDTLQMNTTDKPYQNANNQSFNVSRLRYLISDISFHKADGTCFTIDGYQLVDATQPSTFTYAPDTQVPEGEYTSIRFKFGFDRIDNQGIYADLNAANWGWPGMLGGGYHYMQLEGMYDSSGVKDKFFATHMGTARNNTVVPTTFEDNHFVANPENSAITIDGDFSFEINMDILQWYENPYTWDFNIYNAPIMPVYDAQRKLNLNGPSVFSVNIN